MSSHIHDSLNVDTYIKVLSYIYELGKYNEIFITIGERKSLRWKVWGDLTVKGHIFCETMWKFIVICYS